jgi:hypothetical protein
VSLARRLDAVLAPRPVAGIAVATGLAVALAEWGVLPRAALLVAAPAVVATLLVDTALYNTLSVRTGDGFWLLLSGFVLLQSVAVAAVSALAGRALRRR